MNYKPTHIATFILILFVSLTRGQVLNKSWRDIIHKSETAWFSTTEAKEIAENVLLYQRNIGGWPKNIQMQQQLSEDEKNTLRALKSSTKEVTTDNGATIQEMEFL